MLKRSITAVSILAVVCVCFFWLRQYTIIATDLLILFFAIIGGIELYNSLKKGKYTKAHISLENNEVKISSAVVKPILPAIILAMVIMYPLTYFLDVAGLMATLTISTIVAVGIFTFSKDKYAITDLAATVFNIIYPVIIMGLLIIMNHSKMGLLSIFCVFAVVVGTDTMAYFVGVTCKGPKLCPSISPKKTISGAIGGIIGGSIGIAIAYAFITLSGLFDTLFPFEVLNFGSTPAVAIGVLLPLGIVCSIIAELGDLGASMLKRKIGIKDFGNVFPGHGGVMDRIDGFLFVIPVMYLAFQIIMLITGDINLVL